MKAKIKPADTWFSKCIRHADNWTCQRCGNVFEEGRTGGLDCSHHHGRAKRSVRWCKDNATSLCCGCHKWWHSYPTESAKWLEDKIGIGMIELLREKANQIVKVSKIEEKDIASHYRKEYNRMVKENSLTFDSWQ